MRVKWVGTNSKGLIRIIRIMWTRGVVGDGEGYSNSLSLALYPKLYQYKPVLYGWYLYILGVRIHYDRSYGGYHV
jgi:hypothetical protein